MVMIKKILTICLAAFIGGCSFLGLKSMKAEEHFEPEPINLIEAIEHGNREKAQTLVDQGLDLNVRAKDGVTPLVYFMANSDLDAMELALQLGADPNYHAYVYRNGKVYYEKAPVAILSDGGSTEMFEMLLKHGANPDTVDHRKVPILFNVIGQNDWKKFNLIFKYGGDVNVRDYRGRRASMYAVNIMKFDFVIRLIEMGDDIYALSNRNDTLGFNIAFHLNNGATVSGYRVSDEVYEIKEMLENKGIVFPEIPFEMERESIDLVRQSMARQAQSLVN